MPQAARLDAPGTLHHIIVRGIERRNIVDDNKDREVFVEAMGHLAVDTKTVIYAWAVLNNHGHILLRSSEYGLSKFMRRFLTGYAIRYPLPLPNKCRLLQSKLPTKKDRRRIW